jgi:penicillin-binding protein 1C
VQLEAHLSKREILTLYLERAPFGGTIEGVEAASWAYLGKPAARLSHAEAALLAVLPQAPSRLRPDRSSRRGQPGARQGAGADGEQRRRGRAQVDDARIEGVVSRRLQAADGRGLAGPAPAPPPAGANASPPRWMRACSARWRSACHVLLRPAPRTSAALLVVDNATLEARAYVGSVAFADKRTLGHVDMVQAWRSPGSTLKPFLYGMALDDGLIHSESLLVDAPQAFGGYRPSNFDAAFNGPVSAATCAAAVAQRAGGGPAGSRRAGAVRRATWNMPASPCASRVARRPTCR